MDDIKKDPFEEYIKQSEPSSLVKRAKTEDAEALARLAIQMWTDHDSKELAEEFRELAMN